jgi:hypothetical protein
MFKHHQFSMGFQNFSSNLTIYQMETKQIPKNFHPKQPYLIRALLYRQLRDMNTFVLVVGDPRTSKSSFALSISILISVIKGTTFSVDTQLTFDDIRKFLRWSQVSSNSIFILDETGASLSPQQFWEIQTRVMKKFVQTQGFRRNILFWVLPSSKLLQGNFKIMSNYGIETREQGRVSVNKVWKDQLNGKFGYKWVGTMKFPDPKSKYPKIWNRYMELKKQWNDEELVQDIDYIEQLGTKRERDQLKIKRRQLRDKNLELTVKLKEKKLLQDSKNIPIDVWGK